MFGPNRKIIGVIGLGIIGRAVSANLRQKGFQVFVWNRTPRPVPNFVGSPAEVAELCDFLQIFVSDDEALLETVERLSEKLGSRHIVIAHSTVAPDNAGRRGNGGTARRAITRLSVPAARTQPKRRAGLLRRRR
jgi:3-hydroxyisobutyrate dehydrogenase-like beta-hydroxyacid dehydrogenase